METAESRGAIVQRRFLSLGTGLLLLALVGLVTGIALLPFYSATAEGAHRSVAAMQSSAPLRFLRAAHHWASALLIVLGILLPSHIALSAKRLHDFGVSGWFAVLFLVGDIIAYAILCLVPGQPGPNRFAATTNAPR